MSEKFKIRILALGAAILIVLINILGNAIVLPSFIKDNTLFLLSLLGICIIGSVLVEQVIEQVRDQMKQPGGPSHPSDSSPRQIMPRPRRPERPYLTAVILGVFLSFVSMLFMDLIPIWVRVDPSPTPLQVIPPLVMSLILGGILGKRREAYSAILLAGLLIGVSGDMYMVVKYGPFLPYFPPYTWALIVTDPLTCGLLSWLPAWIRTRTVSPALLLSPPTLEQNKRPRSPTVTVFMILLALILFGGVSFDIYHNVTMAHSGTIGNLSGVAWSGSQFVAVGGIGVDRARGTILTSADGRTWTPQPSGLSNLSMLWNVVWSGSEFVAVGARGIILTSADGRTWTPQPSGTSSLLESVAWSGSQFVAVGGGTTILTSADGRTWMPQSSDTSPSRFYDGVAWSGSQFVVVGDSGILTSADGRTWTPQPSGTSQWLQGVVWSGSQFVAVGSEGIILTSLDGHTWMPQPSGTLQLLNKVAWSGSQFVAVGYGGVILTSADGRAWT